MRHVVKQPVVAAPDWAAPHRGTTIPNELLQDSVMSPLLTGRPLIEA